MINLSGLELVQSACCGARDRLLVAPLLLVISASAIAQQTGTPPRSADVAPTPSVAELRRAGLEENPFVSELLGVSVHLPANSLINVQQIDGGVSVLVTDPSADPPQWTLRIGLLESNMDIPTPRHEIDAHIRSLDATDREYTILRNDDHAVRNATGRHLTIRQTADGGGDSIISGWLLLQNSAKSFVVLSYVTSPDVYELLQSLLDASFDTIHVRSKDDIEGERFNRIIRGIEFLADLNEHRLRELVGREQWFRVYKTTAAGEEELGYSFVQVSEAKRGEVDPSRPEDRYNPSEQVDGLMVTVQGRVINDARRRVFTDSIARFWLSWDQADEVWSVRATVRQGEASLSESETGARHVTAAPPPDRERIGDDDGDGAASSGIARRTLTVVKSSQRDRSTQPVTWEVPQAYLSQALGWLVGRLHAYSESEPITQSYYFYHPASNRLVLRTDEWSDVSDGDGRWMLRTRMGSDAPPIVTRYDDSGNLLRQDRADGAVIEPIDLGALRQLWREKGLPTSSDRQ